jgi:hypothetical protein
MSPYPFFQILIPIISFVLGLFSIPLYEFVRMKFLRVDLVIGFEPNDHDKRYVYKSKWLEGTKTVCQSCYIRFFVKNNTPFFAKQCKAFVTSIEKLDETNGHYKIISYDPLQLTWSHYDVKGAVDLPGYFGRFCDLIYTRSDHKRMEISSDWKIYMLDETFEKIGQYRFSVMVVGENVRPKKFSIVIKWNGHWGLKEDSVSLGDYTPNILLAEY